MSQLACTSRAPHLSHRTLVSTSHHHLVHRHAEPQATPSTSSNVLYPTMAINGRSSRSAVFMQSAAQEPVTAPVDPVRMAEVVKGCRTVLAELQGLDFSKSEVRLYFNAALKLPKGYNARGADMPRAAAALAQLLKKDEDGDPLPSSTFKDAEGLALTQAVLSELWRWRRRGGGMNTEDTSRTHQAALEEIQELKPKEIENIDRMSSSLLDSLPSELVSDQQKKEMSGGMQQMAIGAFQGAVWGSMIFGILAFVLFNFARGG